MSRSYDEGAYLTHRDLLLARLYLFEHPNWRQEIRIVPALPVSPAVRTMMQDEVMETIFRMESLGHTWEPRDVEDLELCAA